MGRPPAVLCLSQPQFPPALVPSVRHLLTGTPLHLFSESRACCQGNSFSTSETEGKRKEDAWLLVYLYICSSIFTLFFFSALAVKLQIWVWRDDRMSPGFVALRLQFIQILRDAYPIPTLEAFLYQPGTQAPSVAPHFLQGKAHCTAGHMWFWGPL